MTVEIWFEVLASSISHIGAKCAEYLVSILVSRTDLSTPMVWLGTEIHCLGTANLTNVTVTTEFSFWRAVVNPI